jgi:hypothetical protein
MVRDSAHTWVMLQCKLAIRFFHIVGGGFLLEAQYGVWINGRRRVVDLVFEIGIHALFLVDGLLLLLSTRHFSFVLLHSICGE